MKPAIWTNSGSATAYGLSWEIYRPISLRPDNQPVGLVTKQEILISCRRPVMVNPDTVDGRADVEETRADGAYVSRHRLKLFGKGVACRYSLQAYLKQATIRSKEEKFSLRCADAPSNV